MQSSVMHVERDEAEGSVASLVATRCAVCGGTSLRHLFSTRDHLRPGDPTNYRVEWCDDCRYGRVGARLTPAQVRQLYDVPYYTHQRVGAAPVKSVAERLRTRLAWSFDQGSDFSPTELALQGGVALDIGCGDGPSMRKFRDAGFAAVGIEPDPDARRNAIAAQVGEVYDGTGEELPVALEGRQFDVVLMSHMLEHCLEPAIVLRNAHRVLRRNGILVVEVPNNEVLGFSRFRALWPWTDVPRHLHFFTPKSLHRLLEAAGFTVSRLILLGFTRHFKSEWITNQEGIWARIGDKSEPQPNFELAAWASLLRTALAAPARKYDTMRLHAYKR
jgi:SAM-dependent methyltransferase